MELHHRAGQVSGPHFDDARALFTEQLGFEQLVATDRMAVLRQPGSDVAIQLICSGRFDPQGSKHQSHIGFISDRPGEEREALKRWCEERGLATEVGQWSDWELWIDVPEVFLDFVIEVMDRRILDEPA